MVHGFFYIDEVHHLLWAALTTNRPTGKPGPGTPMVPGVGKHGYLRTVIFRGRCGPEIVGTDSPLPLSRSLPSHLGAGDRRACGSSAMPLSLGVLV